MNSDLDIICGTRPQLIKAGWIRQRAREFGLSVRVIHIGQHYSSELTRHEGTEPDVILPLSRDESKSDAGVIFGTQKALLDYRYVPFEQCVVLIGDCSVTLGAALYLVDYNFCHLEAGTRSAESLVEGVIRYTVDQLAARNLCPTRTALKNLQDEGGEGFFTGDILLDRWISYANEKSKAEYLRDGFDGPGTYLHTPDRFLRVPDVVVTLHRQQTVDNPLALQSAFETIDALAMEMEFGELTLGLVAHPRLLKSMKSYMIRPASSIQLYNSLPYEVMNVFTREAMLVITDSGGLQREAFWAGTNCVIYRKETEWPELLDSDAVLLTTNPEIILAAYGRLREGYSLNPKGKFLLPEERYALFGGAHVMSKTLEALTK